MMKDFLREHAWLCPVTTILLAGLILLAFGVTWWDIILIVAMLACPLNWLWIFVFGRFPGEAEATRKGVQPGIPRLDRAARPARPPDKKGAGPSDD